MIIGRIAVDNLGGPLTIAYGTYRFAGMDFAEFVFFLGLISINLAVVNFLPIPVLDGGHMVFLIYEKLRGKPASEGCAHRHDLRRPGDDPVPDDLRSLSGYLAAVFLIPCFPVFV